MATDRPGAVLAGRYRLGPPIGNSTRARVLEALDLHIGKQVAIKMIDLPVDLLQRRQWLERLSREVDLGRQLHHPDILTALAASLNETQAWFVLERVCGADLSRYTQPSRLLPETLVLRIGAKLAAALAYAHAQGIVHRDLKAANVLVNLAEGQVKLADFGVARLDDTDMTRSGLTLDTPSYMAPELLTGTAASRASDAYALAVLLFEMFTGCRPHLALSLGELLHQIAREPPTALASLRPDLPAPVLVAIEQLLACDPAQRPDDLARWGAGLARLAEMMSKRLWLDVVTRL
jgi:serine/threonine-protein kinase